MKRIKVSEEEETLILKLRRDRRLYNEGIEVVRHFLQDKYPQTQLVNIDLVIQEIELLKKEI